MVITQTKCGPKEEMKTWTEMTTVRINMVENGKEVTHHQMNLPIDLSKTESDTMITAVSLTTHTKVIIQETIVAPGTEGDLVDKTEITEGAIVETDRIGEDGILRMIGDDNLTDDLHHANKGMFGINYF